MTPRPHATRTAHRRSTTPPEPLGDVQSELPLFRFDLYAVLARAREAFPELAALEIDLWIVPQPTLAQIETAPARKSIRLHPILNHQDMPQAVIAYIIGHELLHLRVPPREVVGERTSHPPEFCEAEARLFPQHALCHCWLWLAFGRDLKRDPEGERILVLPGWKERRGCPLLGLDSAAQFLPSWKPPDDNVLF